MKRYLYAFLVVSLYAVMASIVTTGLYYLFHDEGIVRVVFFVFGFVFYNVYQDYVEPLFNKD